MNKVLVKKKIKSIPGEAISASYFWAKSTVSKLQKWHSPKNVALEVSPSVPAVLTTPENYVILCIRTLGCGPLMSQMFGQTASLFSDKWIAKHLGLMLPTLKKKMTTRMINICLLYTSDAADE